MNGSSGFENAVIQCNHQGTLGQFNLSRDGDILNTSTTNRFSHYHSFVTIVLQYEHADNCITSVLFYFIVERMGGLHQRGSHLKKKMIISVNFILR